MVLANLISCRLSSAEICAPEMQVRLPFHDVYTLFQLGVFKRQAIVASSPGCVKVRMYVDGLIMLHFEQLASLEVAPIPCCCYA